MLGIIEYIVAVLVIVWIVDHIIFRGKDSMKFWITFDITIVFILVMKWIINMFN